MHAEISTSIAATREAVWHALMHRQLEYLPILEVVSDWQPGSSIFWRIENIEDLHGRVCDVQTNTLLHYEVERPPHAPGAPLEVRIALADEGTRTRVTVTQSGESEQDLAHARGGWRLTLGALQALLEPAR